MLQSGCSICIALAIRDFLFYWLLQRTATFGGGERFFSGVLLLSGLNRKVKKLTLLSGTRYFRVGRYFRNSTVTNVWHTRQYSPSVSLKKILEMSSYDLGRWLLAQLELFCDHSCFYNTVTRQSSSCSSWRKSFFCLRLLTELFWPGHENEVDLVEDWTLVDLERYLECLFFRTTSQRAFRKFSLRTM